MNKNCARCEKTVYPTEELKCLDKVWHKGCFKCQECGMTLNMRTYKGYGKLPYCEAHVPKAKHTTIAETPELKRIAENTKLQSNVKYHADFEKSKGKFTQVADDPETLRIKANTRIISNVAYHGDLEKKAQMEKQRTLNENGELVLEPQPDNYQQQLDNYATEMLPPPAMQQQAPTLPNKNQHYHAPSNQNLQDNQYRQEYYQREYQAAQNYQHAQNYQTAQNAQNYQAAQNAQNYQAAQNAQNYQAAQNAQSYHHTGQSYQPAQNYQSAQKDYYAYGQYYGNQHNQQASQKIGKIQDYDPLSDGPRAPPEMRQPAATLVYNSGQESKRGYGGAAQSSQQNRPIGRVADMDPLAGEQQQPQRAPLPAANAAINGRVYVAMYDYDANDSDEVSFREGDLISNVSSIDEGWMTGQVVRTGRTGMLPANYVELARI